MWLARSKKRSWPDHYEWPSRSYYDSPSSSEARRDNEKGYLGGASTTGGMLRSACEANHHRHVVGHQDGSKQRVESKEEEEEKERETVDWSNLQVNMLELIVKSCCATIALTLHVANKNIRANVLQLH
ncbi:hypothetical protein MUK42_28710 [Musa troglodytarum]|uniref:Uncharacterized protein n=1 Tax=Musa troglodytarum TaxID=320322 RepID=A0A9E7FT06_9LILI|nr:hypothetical protein MUK42_28710 [Musa troglodytarum]